MLGKIQPTGPADWEKSSSSADRKRSPQEDTYRKIEKDKDRRQPPSKEEQEQSVEEKDEFHSIFDMSKRNKPKKDSGLDRNPSSSAKGKPFVSREPDSKESPVPQKPMDRSSSSDGKIHQRQGLFASLEKKTERQELSQTPLEEFASEELSTSEEPLPDMEEVPADLSKADKAPVDRLAKPPPKQLPPETIVPQQGALASAQIKPQKTLEKTSEGKEEGKTTKTEKSKGGTRPASEEGLEKGAAGGVHSPIQGTSFNTEKTQEAKEAAPSGTIKDIAAQIVDRIQVMRKDDQTSTIITLKNPPILDGATITLTTSDSAKREFSISFANLSPEGKVLLDNKLRSDSLTETLERKGIIVNSLTTTTQPEKIITADAGQAAQDQRDQREEQEQRQKRQQFEEPEEEERK